LGIPVSWVKGAGCSQCLSGDVGCRPCYGPKKYKCLEDDNQCVKEELLGVVSVNKDTSFEGYPKKRFATIGTW